MKQQQIDTDSVRRQYDLRAFAERYTVLRKQSATTSAGPCPFCGGTDRFVVFVDNFFCNPGPGHCGRKGDIFTLIMDRENTDFIGAYKMLTNGAMPATSIPAQPIKQAAKSTAKPLDAKEYETKVREAHDSLMTGTGRIAQRARDYLTGRGFAMETLKAYKLGFHGWPLPGEHSPEPAIWIPWYDSDSELISIKFRFIDDHFRPDTKGEMNLIRYNSRGPNAGKVFGWQTVKNPSHSRILIICEGEFNAMALWQAAQSDIDVLSTGSESQIDKLPEEIISYAQQYAYRIVWADEKDKANRVARLIKADFSMSSLKADGTKLDANELLKIGKLDALLSGILRRIGADIPVKPEPNEYEYLTIEPEPAPVPSVHMADDFEIVARRLPLLEAITMKDRLNETTQGHRVAHDSDFPRGVHVFMVIKR